MATNHPAVTFRNEPAFQALVSSEQYNKLTPEKRRGLLQAFGEMTAEERQELSSGLNRDPRLPSEANETMLRGIQSDTPDIDVLTEEQKLQRGKTQLATGISLGAGVAVPALLPAGAGILATTGANVLGNVGGRKVNQALGLEEGSPLSVDRWDVLNAAIPTVAGAAQLAKKLVTKPGIKAIQAADTATEANLTRYGKDLNKAENAIVAAEQTAEDQTTRALKAWNQRKAELRNDYHIQMQRVAQRTDLANTKKAEEFQRLTQEYQESIKQHAKAAQGLKDAPEALPVEDYKALYTQVPTDVPVALGNAKRAARTVVDTVDSQFPGFKESALYVKAKGIVDAEGDVPFKQAQQLLSDVGALKATAEGRDSRFRGLIKQLDRGVFEDVMATGDAGSALQKANKAYSRSRSVDDLKETLQSGVVERAADNQLRVSGDAIRKGFGKWLQDPYTAGNFSEEELTDIARTVRSFTNVKRLKQAPGAAPVPVGGDYSKVVAKLPGPKPEPVQPNLNGIEYPDDPMVVEPTMGTFPVAKAIGGRVIAGTLAGGVAGWYGGDQREAAFYGAVGGAGMAVAPHVFSSLLLHGPKGRAALRAIMAGEHTITPEKVAAMVNVARGLKILREDEAK